MTTVFFEPLIDHRPVNVRYGVAPTNSVKFNPVKKSLIDLLQIAAKCSFRKQLFLFNCLCAGSSKNAFINLRNCQDKGKGSSIRKIIKRLKSTSARVCYTPLGFSFDSISNLGFSGVEWEIAWNLTCAIAQSLEESKLEHALGT